VTRLDGPESGATEVTVWFLEMLDPGQLRPARPITLDPLLMQAGRPAPGLAKFFYHAVGSSWNWTDRRFWSDAEWEAWTEQPSEMLTTCWVDGVPAGYYDLEHQGTSTEIVHFGLTPQFLGVGLGGWLLTRAVESAWAMPGVERVWLHTCSLDGPAAVPNYRARGFALYDRTTEWHRLGESAGLGGRDGP
jgi:GNAT superfamily N-acetyltransferase